MESRYQQQLPSHANKDTKPKTVVVIDDDKRVVELLQIALAGSGYRTFSAADGEQAIGLVEKVRPDIVVLDVRLPKKNGYQVCEALRSSPLTHAIPVIMISGLVEPSARVQGLRCGAEDFLTKPFSPKELLLRIQKILARATVARSQAIVSAEAEKELLDKQERMNLAQRKLAERVERVGAVAEMGRTIVGSTSLEELAGQLIVSLQLCLKAGAALIAFREAKDTEFRTIKCRGVGSRQARNVSLPTGGELSARLLAEGRSLTLEELDGVPGMRREILPLRAVGLAAGAAVQGLGGSTALIFVGSGRAGTGFRAEQRQDFESLCRFFGSGLVSIQKTEAEKASMVDAVEMLVGAAENANRCRNGHSCRVARFVESMWESLDLPAYELQAMRLAALLHEVEGSEVYACAARAGADATCGAAGHGEGLSGPLDDADGHGNDNAADYCDGCNDLNGGNDDIGDNRLMADLDPTPGLLSSLRHYREKYDGSGGPLGLRAEQIPLEARILAVADTFDECLCKCQSPYPVDEAIRTLRRLSGTSLDPNLVEALVHHILNGRVQLG